MGKIIVIGAGKMAFSIAHELEQQGFQIEGFTDPIPPSCHVSGYFNKYLGNDEIIQNYNPTELKLAFAISDNNFRIKQKLYDKFKNLGFSFISVIYRGTSISDTAIIEDGVTIFKNVNINAFCKIGKLAVINSNCSIDHDNFIGDNVYLGPGVITGGSVNIGKNVLVGIGTTIFPGVTIGNNAIIGGGSLVLKKIEDNEFWLGSPAKRKK